MARNTRNSRVVRGPVLSSVVMVALASAATGLLAVIGFQALPESVVPTTFGGSQDHETRNVDVSESPTAVLATRKPSVTPSVAPTTTRAGGYVPRPVRTVSPDAPDAPETTTAPRTTAKATAKPGAKPTTQPPASPTPTASPTPSPTCNHRNPKKCPKAPQSYDGYRTPTSADTPTNSAVHGKGHGKSKGAKKK